MYVRLTFATKEEEDGFLERKAADRKEARAKCNEADRLEVLDRRAVNALAFGGAVAAIVTARVATEATEFLTNS